MDDALKKAKEEQKKKARKKIDEINEKLKACDDVKQKLVRCRKKLENEIDSWQRAQRKLNNGSKCAKIIITDQFEGEMAKGLKTHIDQMNNDIKSGISAAEALSEDTQTQIDALNTYANNLKSQKSSWSAKL